jgi:hypothetical protein
MHGWMIYTRNNEESHPCCRPCIVSCMLWLMPAPNPNTCAVLVTHPDPPTQSFSDALLRRSCQDMSRPFQSCAFQCIISLSEAQIQSRQHRSAFPNLSWGRLSHFRDLFSDSLSSHSHSESATTSTTSTHSIFNAFGSSPPFRRWSSWLPHCLHHR